MKDFLGRELAIDDFVVIIEPNYRNYKLAQVIAFTPKSVRVKFTVHGRDKELLQGGYQLVKVEGPDLAFFLLHQK